MGQGYLPDAIRLSIVTLTRISHLKVGLHPMAEAPPIA